MTKSMQYGIQPDASVKPGMIKCLSAAATQQNRGNSLAVGGKVGGVADRISAAALHPPVAPLVSCHWCWPAAWAPLTSYDPPAYVKS
jgi:hypothetical protein